ncbi:GT-D fold domain-containing glycosyltransferase [Helicobacter canis]|uniref:GT-D fold domain-containing glycosyltransferase n=1 Tax=Helicobacter canis TaxID=29419 RepID=UPI0026ECFCB4|nr:GT-D fold domain-containing glycosyltransferase [Helicobacter canis]
MRAFDSPCKAPFLSPKSNREQVESKAQSPDSSSTILEENQASPSLRDTALAVAWQSISQTQSEAAHSGSQISPRLLYACENISAFYVAAYFPSDRVYFDANMFYTTPIEVALLAGKIDTCEYESLESKLKAFPRLFIDDEYGRWLLQLYKDLFIHKIAKLWEQKDCIVIEGRYSSSGVYNDLFSNARSVLRINHLPHHNAYELLDELKSYVQEVLSGFDPAHTCAILALGHSAKVLGFWLDGLGFRAFDIGSLSLNYDCFLYGADFYTYAGQGNPLELESYVLAPYIAGKRR